jgi:hypothetical protein
MNERLVTAKLDGQHVIRHESGAAQVQVQGERRLAGARPRREGDHGVIQLHGARVEDLEPLQERRERDDLPDEVAAPREPRAGSGSAARPPAVGRERVRAGSAHLEVVAALIGVDDEAGDVRGVAPLHESVACALLELVGQIDRERAAARPALARLEARKREGARD